MVSSRPNIGIGGQRRRRAMGIVGGLAALLLLAWFIRTGAAWPVRLLVGIPAGFGALGLFQASRRTCVARAGQGLVEHDDRAPTPMPGGDLAATRDVARGIVRDSVLMSIAAGLLAAATAFIAPG